MESAARTRAATRAVPGCLPEAEPRRPRVVVARLGVGSSCWLPCVSAARGRRGQVTLSSLPFLTLKKQPPQFEAETHFQCACCSWNQLLFWDHNDHGRQGDIRYHPQDCHVSEAGGELDCEAGTRKPDMGTEELPSRL